VTVQRLFLALLGADQLFLEAGDEGVGAQDQRIILCRAALEGLAVEQPLKSITT
jgi:hypothetical protein